MSTLKWEALSPEEFEDVAAKIAKALGYLEVQKRGGPGDRGRDFTATALIADGSAPRPLYVFQCKRQKDVNKAELSDDLAAMEAFRIDAWWLVTSAKLSSQFREWLEAIDKKGRYPFRVHYWDRSMLDDFAIKHRRQLHDLVSHQVLEKLGLPEEPVGLMTGLSALVAAGRSQVAKQTQLFAAKKYVPHLYVRRALERDIDSYYSSERAQAKALKDKCLLAMSTFKRSISDSLLHLQTYCHEESALPSLGLQLEE